MAEYEVSVEEKATRYSRYIVTADSAEEAEAKLTSYFDDPTSYGDDIEYDDSETELDNGYKITEVAKW